MIEIANVYLIDVELDGNGGRRGAQGIKPQSRPSGEVVRPENNLRPRRRSSSPAVIRFLCYFSCSSYPIGPISDRDLWKGFRALSLCLSRRQPTNFITPLKRYSFQRVDLRFVLKSFFRSERKANWYVKIVRELYLYIFKWREIQVVSFREFRPLRCESFSSASEQDSLFRKFKRPESVSEGSRHCFPLSRWI